MNVDQNHETNGVCGLIINSVEGRTLSSLCSYNYKQNYNNAFRLMNLRMDCMFCLYIVLEKYCIYKINKKLLRKMHVS